MVRWTLNHDVKLLKLMQVDFPKTNADWQLLAEKISSDDFQIAGRGAKERWTKTILPKYKSDNTAALKRSGTEEDYTELDQLIQDLADRQGELNLELETTTLNEKKKREEGQKLREMSMLTLKRKKEQDINCESTCSSGTTSPRPDTPNSTDTDIPPRKKFRVSQPNREQQDLLTYMREKDERANELKRQELEIQKQKVENEKRQVENQAQQLLLLQQLLLNQKNQQ